MGYGYVDLKCGNRGWKDGTFLNSRGGGFVRPQKEDLPTSCSPGLSCPRSSKDSRFQTTD